MISKINTEKQPEKWLFILDKTYSPYINMAIDELLLEKCFKFNRPIFRFYSWDRPSVSIGYIQEYSAVNNKRYTIVRRPTGGGIVFHDIDLTYTIVIPKGHKIEKFNRIESYHVFHRAIIKSLYEFGIKSLLMNYESAPQNRMTMQCFKAPTKYDIVLDNEIFSKIAGAAQRRTKYGILHQGSIVLEYFHEHVEKLMNSIRKSMEHEFKIKFEDYFLDNSFLAKAENLSKNKYETEAWNKIR